MAKILPIDFQTERYMVSHFTTESEIRGLILNDYFVNTDQESPGLLDLDKEVARIMKEIDSYTLPLSPMTITLRGEIEPGRVWLFGNEITPDKSLLFKNHSPSGFSWGYAGSGPAQLSLAICIELFGVHRALEIYQAFKFQYITPIPRADFELDIAIDPIFIRKQLLTNQER
jgi:hypothetical protein